MIRLKPSILYNFSSLAPHLNFLSVDRSIGTVAELLGSTESDSTHKWSELQVLNCAHNYITSIDTSLVGLSAIEVLDLSYNLISKIENLQFCFRLVHLNLANNRIRNVENTVATLGNLKVLNLASNGLDSAHGLEKLLGLERLDISENQLMQPLDVARLGHLPNLTQLELRANPLTHIAKWRTQVFTLILKEDLIIDGHAPSSSEKKAIETKRAETPIVPYAGHSTISKIGTIVTERPAFSSYGRALPSENLDPTMAYDYPELKPSDRKVIAEVSVSAQPLHIRPKVSAAASIISSSPSSATTQISSSPSAANAAAAASAAAAATAAAQKRKQQKHPKRRAVADIADPSASPDHFSGEHHDQEHHFTQATDTTQEPSFSGMPSLEAMARTGADGLSPIGDEKELGQILAWAAEDRWLLNYNAYRQRIDEHEAKEQGDEPQLESAKSSKKTGSRTSGEPSTSPFGEGPSISSSDSVLGAPNSSGGSGLLRRKLHDVRRQTLAMPSAFTSEMINELEMAGGANVSNSDFDKMSEMLLAKKTSAANASSANPFNEPATAPKVEEPLPTVSSSSPPPNSVSDPAVSSNSTVKVESHEQPASATQSQSEPFHTSEPSSNNPGSSETKPEAIKAPGTDSTRVASMKLPPPPNAAPSAPNPTTAPGSTKFVISKPADASTPITASSATDSASSPAPAPSSTKISSVASEPAPGSTKLPFASATAASTAAPTSLKLATPPSSAAPAPTSTKLASPASMKLSAPPSSSAPAPAPMSSKFSAAGASDSSPQPAAILLEAASAKPGSFKMAMDAPAITPALSGTSSVSSAPSASDANTASSAPSNPSLPIAVPISTKISSGEATRSSKYKFKIPLDMDVSGSPAADDGFTDLMEPKSPKSPKALLPAPIEEAPKSSKLAVEVLPTEEFLVSTPSAIDASIWEDRIVIVNSKQLEEWDTQGSIVLRLETKELVDVSLDSSSHTVEISFGNTNPRSFSPHSICVYRMESGPDATKLEKTLKSILSASSKRLKCMSCQATFTMQKMLECAKCGKSNLTVLERGSSAASTSDSASETRTSSGASNAQQRQSVYPAASSSAVPHVEDTMDASNIPSNRQIYTKTVHLQDSNGEMEEMHYWFPCYLVPFNTSVQKEQRASVVVSDTKMLIFVKRRARKGSVLAFGKTGREGVPSASEEDYKDEELLASIPLRSLRRIVAGPFWQWFRVESATSADAFMFLSRSHARTFRFLQAFKAKFGWVEVSNKNKECLANVQAAIQSVLRDSRASAAPLVSELDDFAVDLYFMAHQRIKSGFSLLNAVRASTMIPAQKDTTLAPRSIILTRHNVFIVEEDYARWPSLAVANWVTPKTPHFTILHHYSYHDIVSLATVHPNDHPNFVAVTFEYNTASGATSQQQIVLITQGEAERAKFISLLSQRYQEHFHIKLVPDQN